MPTADELRALKGKRVTLHLSPEAGGPGSLTGRILGLIEAADGLSVAVEPDDKPGTRLTVHYHHIVTARPL